MRSLRLSLAQLCLLALTGCYQAHSFLEEEAPGARLSDAGADSMGSDPGTDAIGALEDAESRPARGCSPQDARPLLCTPDCDGFSISFYWNGDDCIPATCDACEGEDCGQGTQTREACLDLHRECEPALCESTGGTWRFWANDDECFDPCGIFTSDTCLTGPACDCGYHQAFVPSVGCVDTAVCPEGEPSTARDTCEGSGGEWGLFCRDSVCGVESTYKCGAEACHCPGPQVFDGVRGCIESRRCFEPGPGESCDERARCQAGSLCCNQCDREGCRSVCLPPWCARDTPPQCPGPVDG